MARFTEMLEKIMEEKEWNRQELARHYKVSKSQVTRWFGGQLPRADTFETIKADYDKLKVAKAV